MLHKKVVTMETCGEDHCFFFFQAEDGIRDVAVTGVQTCALPISTQYGAGPDGIDRRRVDVRAADDRGDQCRLAGRDLTNLLAEIRPRRGPDPAHRDRDRKSVV